MQDTEYKLCSGPTHPEPVMLPRSCFSRDKHKTDGLRAQCKACSKQHTEKWKAGNRDKLKAYDKTRRNADPEGYKLRIQTWRQNNPERYRAIARDWAGKNPDKITENSHKRRAHLLSAQGVITSNDYRLLLHLCRYTCLMCGSRENLTLDHIIPLSRGGDNTIFNAQILCRSHNAAKRDRHSTDYRPFILIPLSPA